ncbi:energy transducer TonB [Rhodothermus bifroesti]|uniref:Energy transducer TonB n=1 Tax=Rhodothermus marinus TaxID=29549 RepID=A0A7V2B082_RHOMR|nr:energy transducer TonB [Rhodothermus bifroesti]GBD01182.1 hypothetical protein HRbin18_00902 [bacterium HR18]
MSFRLCWAAILLIFVGCGRPSLPSGPPEGWQATEERWWRSGVDTTVAFRPLESLATMGLETGASATAASRGELLVEAVRRSLTPLFRVQPEIIDSLFRRYVAPKVAQATLTEDVEAEIDRLREESYRSLLRYFREPRPITRLGEEVPLIYPDSLVEKGVTGRVEMQVYLNAEGEPEAIWKLEGVHPVLDLLAMEATTQMRWQPAYVRQGNTWITVPSWVRFNIHYQIQGE